MAKNKLYLKIPNQDFIPVKTNIPCTLLDESDTTIGIANGDKVELIKSTEDLQRKVVQSWNHHRNDWDYYDVVWNGASEKSLVKSKLPTQKGLLTGDRNSQNMTGVICEQMEMYSPKMVKKFKKEQEELIPK